MTSYQIKRRNPWKEAYYTLRMFVSGAGVYLAMAHEDERAMIVCGLMAVIWWGRANNECLKP